MTRQVYARSKYADRLGDVADYAAGDAEAFARRGRWRDWLGERLGHDIARLVVEIGCHDADLLARVAARHPHVGFVGIDWKFKAIHDGAIRLRELGLKNAALVRGRGQDLARLFAPGEVNEIWLFHPDPGEKPAERANRLMNESFLRAAHEALRDAESTLTLKTDHAGYYQQALSLFGLTEPAWFAEARSGRRDPSLRKVRAKELADPAELPARSDALVARLHLTFQSPDLWNDPAAPEHLAMRAFGTDQTAFERRFVQKRWPIYYLEFTKRAS